MIMINKLNKVTKVTIAIAKGMKVFYQDLGFHDGNIVLKKTTRKYKQQDCGIHYSIDFYTDDLIISLGYFPSGKNDFAFSVSTNANNFIGKEFYDLMDVQIYLISLYNDKNVRLKYRGLLN